MADRNATSYRQETGNVGAVLQAAKSIDGSELDLNQFVLSKSSAWRARKDARAEMNEHFYKSFTAPHYSALHWDEKFCKEVMGQDFGQGHIAVLLSGEGYEEGLLIDLEGLPNGEGETLATVCYEAVVKCRCKENVKVLVFDTTSSNSGKWQGAATILQRDKFVRKLIMAACRKHIAELFVTPVDKLLFGESKSGHFEDFKEFQTIWKKLPTTDDPVTLDKNAEGVKVEFTTKIRKRK